MATPPDSPIEEEVVLFELEPKARTPKPIPVALEDLCRLTKFTRQEIRVMYRGFKTVSLPRREGGWFYPLLLALILHIYLFYCWKIQWIFFAFPCAVLSFHSIYFLFSATDSLSRSFHSTANFPPDHFFAFDDFEL